MEANNKELTDEEDGTKMELQRLTSVTSERPMRAVSASAQEELLNAIKKNSVDDVKRLLPEVDLEYTYGIPDFGSCLYIAAKEGSVDVAKMLIDHEADVNRYNATRKNTPLHIASELGHSDMVKLLIDEGGKLKNRDSFGRTALHWAAFGGKMGNIFGKGHLKTIKELIDAGSPKNAKDRQRKTPLLLAVTAGHKDAVRLLIESGANPDADLTCRSFIEMKMPDVYDEVLLNRIYNSPEEDDVDVLLFDCLYERDVDKCKALLVIAIEKGLDLSQINDGLQNLLQCACEIGGLEKVVGVLLDSGVNPNAALHANNDQPLLLAACQGNSNALSLLVDRNVTDISVSDEKAETALHKAAKMGKTLGEGNHQECIEILIKCIEKVDDKTPKRKRLDVNAIDAKGNIALHYAAYNLEGGDCQAGEITAALLRAESCFGIRNKEGELAISRIPIPVIE